MVAYANMVALGSSKGSLVMYNRNLVDLLGRIEDSPTTGTSEPWIFDHTGIISRPIASAKESVYTLAIEAAENLYLSPLGQRFSPQGVNEIIVATNTQPKQYPMVASAIAENFNLHCGTRDVVGGCTGWLDAVNIGWGYIANGAEQVLVIGVETLSHMTSYMDRNSAILFGDAAGAVLLTKSRDPGISGYVCGSKPELGHLIDKPWKTGRHLEVTEHGMFLGPEITDYFFQMDGPKVHTWVVGRNGAFATALETLLAKTGSKISDIHAIIPHQANDRMYPTALTKYYEKHQEEFESQGVNLEDFLSRIVIYMSTYGNTSTASIPITLEHALNTGKLEKGKRAALVAFGAGLMWGAMELNWDPDDFVISSPR